jgi:transcriptional activator for dhaKLM operon
MTQDLWHPDADLASVPPPIRRSWERCVAARLNPAGPLPLSTVLSQPQPRLLDLVRSSIEDLYQLIVQPGFAVVLADAQAHILDLEGDQKVVDDAGRLGLQCGVSLREEDAGTNAVDLALRDALPIQTSGSQHYRMQLHGLAFAAAPIFDVSGSALGVIAILTREQDTHPHTLGMAIAAAQALNNQLRTEHLLAEANDHLAELYATLETISEGLIFVGPDEEIRRINSRAAQILALSARSVPGHPFAETGTPPPRLLLALRNREELIEQELIWQSRSGTIALICSLRPVRERGRRYLGALITLRPIQSVHQLVQRVVGAHAQFTFHDIIGQSSLMHQALHQAHLAANASACVWLQGEPGVGKDLFAQAIHNASSRASGPFVRINCAAVPRTMLTAELFGVEAAQNDGQAGRPGKLELAQGGVLYLEEVGILSFEQQTSLLRTIEMRHIIRTYGKRPVPIDVRIIAADSSDIEQQVAEGRFRADLAARLRVCCVEIPPLRARGDDLLLLANHFLALLNERFGKQSVLAPDALEALRCYDWPGNVRELELTLERLLQLSEKSVLTRDDLPQSIALAVGSAQQSRQPSLAEHQQLSDCEAIIRAGRQASGHLGRTAALLGISRATLWRKMSRYGLSRDHFWRA